MPLLTNEDIKRISLDVKVNEHFFHNPSALQAGMAVARIYYEERIRELEDQKNQMKQHIWNMTEDNGNFQERIKELERDLDLEKCDHIYTNDISEERYEEIKQLEQIVKELEQQLEDAFDAGYIK